MTKILRALLFALPALPAVAFSCTVKFNDNILSTGECLRICSVSAASPSRAVVAGTDFPTDEDISIGVFTYSSRSGGYTNRNVKFTRKAGRTEWTSDKGVTLTSEAVTVYAYYPWTSGAGTAALPVSSSIDGDDWMWATPVGNVSLSNPTIDLTMNHFLSLVELVFSASQCSDGTEVTSISVSTEGAGLTGSVNFLGGAVSGDRRMTGSDALTGSVRLPLEDGVAKASCLLIPYTQSQTGRFALDISCTFDGHTFNASLPQEDGILIKPGVKSTVTLGIKDNFMTVESAEISVEEENPEFIEEADDNSADYKSGSLDCSNLKALGHPRIFLTAEGMEELKRKVTLDRFNHKELYKLHKVIIELADECVLDTTPIEYQSVGGLMHQQGQMALKRLFTCSYAFKMTGRMKYLEKARTDLAAACSCPDWNPSTWLGIGEMSLGVGIAYDWLYYSLTLEERTLIHRKLVDYCINDTHKPFYNTKGNWNQVCFCGCLTAALAVYEKDKYDSGRIIGDLLTYNKKAMEGIYSPDGNYSEGYDYWAYGTGFQVMIMQMLQTAFGTMFGLEQVPGFLSTADYMLYMSGPCGKSFPYADGSTSTERANLPMWWFAAHRNDPSLLFNEMRLYKAGDYPGMLARIYPLLPIIAKDMDLDNMTCSKPAGHIFTGEGIRPVVMVRTTWTCGSDDAYFGMVGGYANCSHGHMDAGSFVYDAFGYRWSEDYMHPLYSEMEAALGAVGANFWDLTQGSLRWDIFKYNNLAHSTLSVMNGTDSEKLHPSDHLVGSSSSKTTLVESYTSGNALGGKMDMTAAVSDGLKSAYRTIKLINGTVLEITDELSAPSAREAQVQWRMNTVASVTVSGSEILLKQGDRTMSLTVASSDSGLAPTLQNFGKTRPSSWTARDWDTGLNNNIVGFSVTVPKGKSVTFITRLTPKN